MKIIILDFTDWKVKIINNMKEWLDTEDAELIMVRDYDISLSNIEYMIVSELEIETFN